MTLKVVLDAAQDGVDVASSSAARVEHVDALVRQTVGDAEFVLQCAIDPRDHVVDDLGRRIPDTELFAELRIEGFEERLVEILDGLALLEAPEEFGGFDTVEGVARPVQNLD
ncbi:hypothetical protein GGI59_005468 [Rhizobium lentis]|uniref:Uncharacterized protein n=1 Tax=Rhizobium lentis TaxID=1138194 RepID=A0A7W8XIY1_9HYPH|nr:hypothetical protein [Rhizobium lentis]MBB5563769.1 hypothetical protein [Rhizobium lentis]MBB5570716.1 hypothetical protein [Rhizobium lentis]